MNDLISKQIIIDGFYEMASDTDHLCTVKDFVEWVESLPSVPSERKKGRWIRVEPGVYKCSNCGVTINNGFFNYCHRCGAEM